MTNFVAKPFKGWVFQTNSSCVTCLMFGHPVSCLFCFSNMMFFPSSSDCKRRSGWAEGFHWRSVIDSDTLPKAEEMYGCWCHVYSMWGCKCFLPSTVDWVASLRSWSLYIGPQHRAVIMGADSIFFCAIHWLTMFAFYMNKATFTLLCFKRKVKR